MDGFKKRMEQGIFTHKLKSLPSWYAPSQNIYRKSNQWLSLSFSFGAEGSLSLTLWIYVTFWRAEGPLSSRKGQCLLCLVHSLYVRYMSLRGCSWRRSFAFAVCYVLLNHRLFFHGFRICWWSRHSLLSCRQTRTLRSRSSQFEENLYVGLWVVFLQTIILARKLEVSPTAFLLT